VDTGASLAAQRFSILSSISPLLQEIFKRGRRDHRHPVRYLRQPEGTRELDCRVARGTAGCHLEQPAGRNSDEEVQDRQVAAGKIWERIQSLGETAKPKSEPKAKGGAQAAKGAPTKGKAALVEAQ
jgi:hypothetical protein